MKHTLRKLAEMFFTETVLLAVSPVYVIVESRINMASYPRSYAVAKYEARISKT